MSSQLLLVAGEPNTAGSSPLKSEMLKCGQICHAQLEQSFNVAILAAGSSCASIKIPDGGVALQLIRVFLNLCDALLE
ncbi:hypothetical protein LJR231_005679 [Phyllobacterium sp. LjRoot231]